MAAQRQLFACLQQVEGHPSLTHAAGATSCSLKAASKMGAPVPTYTLLMCGPSSSSCTPALPPVFAVSGGQKIPEEMGGAERGVSQLLRDYGKQMGRCWLPWVLGLKRENQHLAVGPPCIQLGSGAARALS